MGALLAIIPTKDKIIGALVVGLGILCWHFYDKYEDAVKYAGTVKAESVAAEATAKATIDSLTLAYTTGLTNMKDANDALLKTTNALHVSDLDRVRSAAAARASDAVLHGSQGTAAEAAAWAKRLDTLESISAGLADAVRNDDAAVQFCWAERDLLTGK